MLQRLRVARFTRLVQTSAAGIVRHVCGAALANHTNDERPINNSSAQSATHERHQRLEQSEWRRLVDKTAHRVREIDRISVEQTAVKALLDRADLADQPRTD